jgi:hypothetical protein
MYRERINPFDNNQQSYLSYNLIPSIYFCVSQMLGPKTVYT